MARRFRGSGRGQRLSRRWIGSSTGTAFFALTAGTAAVQIFTPTAFRDTIMRTRGALIGYVDGAIAPFVAVLVSVGLWVVPEGTGSTVLADPFDDENADWFFYSQFLLGYEEHVVDVIDNPVAAGYREVIDSKAMRIANPDTEVQCVVTNTTVNGAGAINLHLAIRSLIGQ